MCSSSSYGAFPFPGNEDRGGTTTILAIEETITQMYLWKAVIANMLSMIGNATGTTYTVRTPVTKREVGKVVFLHLLGRELRVEQLRRPTRSCFLLLTFWTAYTRLLSWTRLNWIGAYGYRTSIV